MTDAKATELERALEAALADDEGRGLSGVLEALGLIESPPPARDLAVLAAARSARDPAAADARALDEALSRGEDAALGGVVERLGLVEDPPAQLDAVVLQAARDASQLATPLEALAGPRRSRRPHFEEAGERSGARRAASAGVLWWLRALARERTFEVITAACAATGLAIVVAAIDGSPRPEAPPAAPASGGREPWVIVTAPPGVQVPAGSGVESPPVRHSTTGSAAPIAEVLSGAVAIGELGADGTLEVRRAIPLGAGAPAKGRVRIARLESRGGEAHRERFGQAAGEAFRKVLGCYEEVLALRPAAGGTARIRLALGAGGAPPSLEVSELGDGELTACLRDGLSGLRWTGGPLDLDATVLFEPVSSPETIRDTAETPRDR